MGYFPRGATLASHTPDVAHVHLFRPLVNAARRASARLRWLQQGRVQLYVLYIFGTLLVLLLWKLGI